MPAFGKLSYNLVRATFRTVRGGYQQASAPSLYLGAMMLDPHNQRDAVEVRELLGLIQADDRKPQRCARVAELLNAICARLTGRPCDPEDARRVCEGGQEALSALLRAYQSEQLFGLEKSLYNHAPAEQTPTEI